MTLAVTIPQAAAIGILAGIAIWAVGMLAMFIIGWWL